MHTPYLVFLTLATLFIVFITRRRKAAERHFKRPVKTRRERVERAERETGTSKEGMAPAMRLNEIKRKERKIKKGEEVKENSMVVRGSIGIYRGEELVGRVRQGRETHSGMEILGIEVGMRRIAEEETRIVEIGRGDEGIGMVEIEKRMMGVASRYEAFHGGLIRFEGRSCRELREELRRELGVDGEVSEIEMEEGEERDIEEVVHVVSGAVRVNGRVFGAGMMIGILGVIFRSCRNIFRFRAVCRTRMEGVDYGVMRRGVESVGMWKYFIESFRVEEVPEILFELGALAQWVRLYPGGSLYEAGEMCEALYIVDGVEHCAAEALLGQRHAEGFRTDKLRDCVAVPVEALERGIRYDAGFARQLLGRAIGGKREVVQPGSRMILVVPATDGCADFMARLQRTFKSICEPGRSCVVVRSRDLFAVSKGRISGPGELLITEHLASLREEAGTLIIYLENEWSTLLQICADCSDALFVVGREPVPNRIERGDIEFVQLHQERGVYSAPQSGSNRARGSVSFAYRRTHHIYCPTEDGHCTKDLERFVRYILGERVGLVLGGGGARGFAHVGVIQALEEASIPIDCIGGTSMGAFTGAVYARSLDFSELYSKSRFLSKKCGSLFYFLLDLTYPYVSLFTGRSFDWALSSVFGKSKIEHLWIEFFCVATDLLAGRESIHTVGLVWKWVRASMSICGYLPPYFLAGTYYVDGAYVNNLPADVMNRMNVRTIIAVDVGDRSYQYIDPYDSKSGFVLAFRRFFASKRYLSLSDLQYRLAFLSSREKLRKLDKEILVIKPELDAYKSTDFANFDEIVACGYVSAKAAIEEWRRTGLLDCERNEFRKSETQKNAIRDSAADA